MPRPDFNWRTRIGNFKFPTCVGNTNTNSDTYTNPNPHTNSNTNATPTPTQPRHHTNPNANAYSGSNGLFTCGDHQHLCDQTLFSRW